MDLHDKSILLIEDDKHIYALIEAMFEPYTINLVLQTDGRRGLEAALTQNFDLILLDIMLPGKDGWEICRKLKEKNIETPIIIITAKVEETDKVLGLEIGADDYVTKPFSPRELIARIKAVLRRFEKTSENSSDEEIFYSKNGVKINSNTYVAEVDGKTVSLTPKEFELLAFLAENEEQVFKREQLLDKIWGFANYTQTRTVDEHIKRIRKKLAEAGLEQNPVKTIWGVGYKFSMEEV